LLCCLPDTRNYREGERIEDDNKRVVPCGCVWL
jgi:hypothetical protein